ncbi:MAG: 2-C-methyl-D-erythritol 2,4-cyclodiphosphate synthase [Bacteroidales bacterium]|nr:2-C-methyl-D-erythritol 2,4-cyclodiphosphate synthase [Bacteroidales bacterium]MDZ4203908.1 2-C-methyl-D-erythritol 2,4-cyclodiphosphate synthase [Bacteroidales bacterium]
MKIRVGFGYDVHRLSAGRKLIIGGVEIPSPIGLLGHSDADVLIHSVCDALLGAAGFRDIGNHFPDTDPKYKNADSRQLLAQVVDLIVENGFEVGNVDCTLILENPKISSYIPLMIGQLSGILKIDEDSVSIKATTSESLGFIGRQEGVVAYTVVLIASDAL